MFSLAVVTVMLIYLDDIDYHIFIDVFDSDDFFLITLQDGWRWAQSGRGWSQP